MEVRKNERLSSHTHTNTPIPRLTQMSYPCDESVEFLHERKFWACEEPILGLDLHTVSYIFPSEVGVYFVTSLGMAASLHKWRK